MTEWLDKCRCGRIIKVRVGNQDDGSVGIRKEWYAKDGTFERVTGQNEKQAETVKTPPDPRSLIPNDQ